jgi:hypothetical protein
VKRKKKKINIFTLLLFLIFAINASFIMYIGANMHYRLNMSKVSRASISKNAIFFKINEPEILFADLVEEIKLNNQINNISLIQDDEENKVRKIYFKGKYDTPQMEIGYDANGNEVTGRFFTEQDFEGEQAFAVVGLNRSSEIFANTILLNEQYIPIIGNMTYQYQMIGPLDDMIIVNYNGDKIQNRKGAYVLDSDSKKATQECFSYLKKKYELTYPQQEHTHTDGTSHQTGFDAVEQLDVNQDGIDRIFKDALDSNLFYLIAIVCFSLSSITVSSQWVNRSRKSIAVKRLIGWRNSKLIREVYLKFFKYSCLGTAAAFVIASRTIMTYINNPIYILVILVFNILLDSLILLPLIQRVLKVPVAEILR